MPGDYLAHENSVKHNIFTGKTFTVVAPAEGRDATFLAELDVAEED